MANGSPLGGALVGGLIGLAGGFLQERGQRKFRRRQRRAISQAREFADETVSNIINSELFSSAQDFITSTFRDAADSPLAQDFGKRIRSQQAIRGTFTGNLAAAQEAIGVSGFAQQLRSSLLSPALQFATTPERLRQSILSVEAPLRVAAATGAQLPGLGAQGSFLSPLEAMLGQGLSGGAAGFQLGLERQQSQELQALRQAQGEREGFSVLDPDTDTDSLINRIRALSEPLRSSP